MNDTYQTKYQNNFYPGSNPTINQDCTFEGTVIQSGGQGAPLQHFTHCRSDKYLKMLWSWLVKEKYIDAGTNCENFVYLFGGFEASPKVTPIVWLMNIQVLRELLTTVFDPALRAGQISAGSLKDTACFCFVKDGKPAVLAKNKPTDGLESRKLCNFLATLAEQGIE